MKLYGQNASPYRPPCSGYAASEKLHLDCNRAAAGRTPLTRWQNITKVTDYRLDSSCNPVDPNGIPPYPREKDFCENGIRYEQADCFNPAVCPSSKPKCANQPLEYLSCPPPSENMVVVDGNCYQRTDQVITPDPCQFGFFKLVQAVKVWHGSFGFRSNDRARQYNSMPKWFCGFKECDTTNATCNCGVACATWSPALTPDQTRFLQVQVDASGHFAPSEGSSYGPLDINRQFTGSVDRLSGVLSQLCSGTPRDSVPPEFTGFWDIVNGLSSWCNSSGAYACGRFEQILNGYKNTECPNGYTFQFTISGSSVRVVISNTDGQWEDMTVDFSAASFVRTRTTVGGATVATESFNASNTSISWTTSYLDPDPPPGGWYTLQVAVTLSSPYTAAQLRADLDALLAQWDLANDSVYPWRADEYTSVGPLVYRDEKNAPQPAVCGSCAITVWLTETESVELPWIEQGYYSWPEELPPGKSYGDPKPPLYTGAIVGAPNPAGFDNHFDAEHQTFELCGSTPILRFIGDWSGPNHPAEQHTGDPTDPLMPKSATRWTENFLIRHRWGNLAPYRAGAWLQMRDGILAGQKWAESRVLRPSLNYFRPCGPDRWLLDESRAVCIKSVSGDGSAQNPFVLTTEPITQISTGTRVFALGSVWTVTKLADDSYRLDPGSDAPFGGSLPDDPVMIPLWFPDARPICGRAEITNVLWDGNLSRITFRAELADVRDGDHLDFFDAAMNPAATDLVITNASATQFDVPGVDLSSAKYVTARNAPAWWWFTNRAKFDYCLLQWKLTERDITETDGVCGNFFYNCRKNPEDPPCSEANPGLDCNPTGSPYWSNLRVKQTQWGMPREVYDFTCQTKCLPPGCRQVICVSPNGENFGPSSETIAFPSVSAWQPDGTCHTAWCCVPVQHVPDPFWQPPHQKCVICLDQYQEPQVVRSVCDQVEDTGFCQEDSCFEECDPQLAGTRLYPQRPWVECRCAPPPGAPDLPSNVTPVGFASLEELNSDTPPTKHVAVPPLPFADGFNVPTFTPWGLWLRQFGCACPPSPEVEPGRFSEQYSANGIIC